MVDARNDWALNFGRPQNSDEIPPPPWQLRSVDFVTAGVMFDEAAVRRWLPSGWEPTKDVTGGFYIYLAPQGWGPPPYSAGLGWIDVEGYDASDGSKGRYPFFMFYEDRGYRGFKRYFADRNMSEGAARIVRLGSVYEAFAGPIGRPDYLRLKLDVRPGQNPPLTSGVHNYVVERAGGVQCMAASFVNRYYDAVPLAVDYTVPLDHPLGIGPLKPKSIIYAGIIPESVATIGAPYIISGNLALARQGVESEYLNLLGQIGLGAILVAGDGRVIISNTMATALLGDGLQVVDRRLLATDPQARVELAAAVNAVIDRAEGRFALDPIAIPRPSGRKRLIVQVVRLEAPSVGPEKEVCALLLITDPARAQRSEPAKILELLGLTPSEARIAALVGSGLSPRETAETAGNTEGTVRYTLKQVYEKLDIGRQSELAKLVARLETIGR